MDRQTYEWDLKTNKTDRCRGWTDDQDGQMNETDRGRDGQMNETER